jgi:hypothetical protein
MAAQTVKYTVSAAKNQNWADAAKGIGAIAKESATIAGAFAYTGGTIAVGVVTTPIRIFKDDIPQFVGAVNERGTGKDRAWDVVYTGANLLGDVSGTYLIGKGASSLMRSKSGSATPFRNLMENSERSRYENYWSNSISKHSPNQYTPYGIYNRFTSEGRFYQSTIYNAYGRKAIQYDFMSDFGEHYHNFGTLGNDRSYHLYH